MLCISYYNKKNIENKECKNKNKNESKKHFGIDEIRTHDMLW